MCSETTAEGSRSGDSDCCKSGGVGSIGDLSRRTKQGSSVKKTCEGREAEKRENLRGQLKPSTEGEPREDVSRKKTGKLGHARMRTSVSEERWCGEEEQEFTRIYSKGKWRGSIISWGLDRNLKNERKEGSVRELKRSDSGVGKELV